MSAWRREAERDSAALVAAASLPWREWGDAPAAASVVAVSLVGHTPSAAERRRAFEHWHAQLPPSAFLIVADHNRPRRRLDALGALIGAPWVPGTWPTARWRRLAAPTAREVQAAGFRVLRLALVARERVQIVIARRDAPLSP